VRDLSLPCGDFEIIKDYDGPRKIFKFHFVTVNIKSDKAAKVESENILNQLDSASSRALMFR